MTGDFADLEMRILPPLLEEDRAEIAAFLESHGLSSEGSGDYTVAFSDGERLVGVGSLVGRVIQGLAVEESRRSEGLALRIVSELEAEAVRRGLSRLLVYTKPGTASVFEQLGYRPIGEAAGAAVLLEKGGGIQEWCAELRAAAAEAARARQRAAGASGPPSPAAGGRRGTGSSALVMNCNPFTLGHEHLVRSASAASDLVLLFVVREEASSFPFEVRLRLVREGTAGLGNVAVIPGGEYIVSRATFPTYFLKDRAGEEAAIHARLDLDVFGRWIAPAVGATRRFVAEEPYSEVTALYNRTMREALPAYGIEVVEIPRLAVGGEAVSASTVRRRIKEGRLDLARALVPPSTWSYLASPEARPVLERVAAAEGRH